MIAGIRVAAVIGVGTATIAAAVGAGGLGEYIFRGLSMVDPTVILAGAVPAAVLALPWTAGCCSPSARSEEAAARGATLAIAAIAALAWRSLAAAMFAVRPAAGRDVIRVGSKNFTEQIVLGEIVAQQLERAGLTVERRLNLGGTFICDRALRSGDIDVYVEYTGTADTAVFKKPVETDPASVLERVRQRYAEGGLTVLPSLGFENTFAILVRGEDARRLGLRDDRGRGRCRRRRWQAGFGYEFLQRADGYPGLSEKYGLRFAARAEGDGPVAHLPRAGEAAGRSHRRRRHERPHRRPTIWHARGQPALLSALRRCAGGPRRQRC